MTTAHEILQAAQKHMQDRASAYDKPEGERSMSDTVSAFNAITGHTLTDTQGWLFMAVLKAVRSQQGDYHADSYEDGAAYFALAGEAASRGGSSEDRAEWIPNSTKERPVGSGVNVLVELRDGSRTCMPIPAGFLSWDHTGSLADIIAYRIVK